jgi:hypothetical protein
VPARCTSTGRRPDKLNVNSAAREQPGDQRVRVPHLPSPKLIAAPNGNRGHWNELEEAPSHVVVLREPLGALDRFVDIRNDSVAPTPHLITEGAKASREPGTDGPFRDDAPLLAKRIPNRCLLDHETPLRDVHDECRVIEVARAAVSQPGGDRFEDLPIEANGVASGAERQPVEIHGRTRSDLRDHIPIVSENSDDGVGYDTESGCGKAAVQHRALDKQEGAG